MSRSSLLGLLIPSVVGLPFLVGAVVVFAQVAIFVCSASKTEATAQVDPCVLRHLSTGDFVR